VSKLGDERNECRQASKRFTYLAPTIGEIFSALFTRENNALAFQSDLTAAKFDKASFMQHIARESSLAHSFFSSTGIYPAHLKQIAHQ
jgi:hypothetical protein